MIENLSLIAAVCAIVMWILSEDKRKTDED